MIAPDELDIGIHLDGVGQAVLHGFPGPVAIIGRDLKYRYTNHDFDAAISLRAGGAIGRSLRETLGEEASRPLVNQVKEVLQAAETVRIPRLELRPPGRRSVVYDTSVIPVPGPRGSVEAALVLLQEAIVPVEGRRRRPDSPLGRGGSRGGEAGQEFGTESQRTPLRRAGWPAASSRRKANGVGPRSDGEWDELSRLLDTIPGGVWVVDSLGRDVCRNAAVEQILGSDPDGGAGGRGRRPGAFLHLDGVTPLSWEESPLGRALTGETVGGERILVSRSDGSQIVVLASAGPLPGDGDEINGAVGSFLDVTRLYRSEQRYSEELALVSHDLRSPLTSVYGQAQLIEQMATRSGDEKLANSASMVLRAARRMKRMVDDLVEVARLEGGSMELNCQPVKLPALVIDLIDQMALTWGNRVRFHASRGFPVLEIDGARMERVITNLVANALHHSAEGDPVAIRLWTEGNEARLAVDDLGIGIQPSDLPHIFERRYRVRGSRRAGGLGLGLYICRGIIEAHGGRIWAQSQPGRGSSFHAALPL